MSGVAASGGRDLTEAGQGAARLILSGWPFRMRYPRGLGLAFVKPGFGTPAESFLQPWRILMGPKMRTVCSVLSSPGRLRGLDERAACQRGVSRSRLFDRTGLCRGIRHGGFAQPGNPHPGVRGGRPVGPEAARG